MKLAVKGDDGNIKYFFTVVTAVTPKSSIIDISDKEIIIKNQDTFEYFSRTTQDPDLVYAVENLCVVWSLK